MPPKGIKRTNISNSSDNSSSSVCVDKKQTKKKSRKKSKIVLKNVNTGNSTGDISNVNKPSDTLQSPYLYNDLYTNMNSTNPTQFSQDILVSCIPKIQPRCCQCKTYAQRQTQI